MRVVLSCEHASWAAPEGVAPEAVLRSHVGWDAGAAELARALQGALRCPLHLGERSRLWVDLNRSADAAIPTRSFGVDLPANERLSAAQRGARLAVWERFRDAVRAEVGEGPTLHISVHSFDPALDPERRTYPVGLLFDPARAFEVDVATRWQGLLLARGFDTRLNEPYLGVDDGHTTALRRALPDARYAGLELELNQAHHRPEVVAAIVQSLEVLVGALQHR